MTTTAVNAPNVLNEASEYGSAFSRALKVDLGNHTMLLVSGTASIGPDGKTMHVGDFRLQTRRVYHNLTQILAAAGMTWKDVVRTTCYLRDIERDYKVFNEERNFFYNSVGLNPYPASTGIQAILCRPDLLVEIELMAIRSHEPVWVAGPK